MRPADICRACERCIVSSLNIHLNPKFLMPVSDGKYNVLHASAPKLLHPEALYPNLASVIEAYGFKPNDNRANKKKNIS